MRVFQVKISPTMTGKVGAEKEIVIPALGITDDLGVFVSKGGGGAGVAEVIGRLLGRLVRCKFWVGRPKLGFRVWEKSTLLIQLMVILAPQLFDTKTVAITEIERVLAVELLIVIAVGFMFCSGCNLKRNVKLSFGRHGVGISRAKTGSARPLESLISAASRLTFESMYGLTSKSRDAIVVG